MWWCFWNVFFTVFLDPSHPVSPFEEVKFLLKGLGAFSEGEAGCLGELYLKTTPLVWHFSVMMLLVVVVIVASTIHVGLMLLRWSQDTSFLWVVMGRHGAKLPQATLDHIDSAHETTYTKRHTKTPLGANTTEGSCLWLNLPIVIIYSLLDRSKASKSLQTKSFKDRKLCCFPFEGWAYSLYGLAKRSEATAKVEPQKYQALQLC